MIQDQKCNNNKCQCECEKYCEYKKDYSWNSSTYICENSKYFKSIAYDSKIVYELIINATESASTNFDNKIVRFKMN